jgi:hypothetical protein
VDAISVCAVYVCDTVCEQKDLELRAVTTAAERYHEMLADVTSIGKGCRLLSGTCNDVSLVGATMKPAQRVLLRWFEPLMLAITAQQRRVRAVGRDRARGDASCGRRVAIPRYARRWQR